LGACISSAPRLIVIHSFAGLGITNTIAVFQSYVSTHQLAGYSESSIGWIFSLYTFLAFFCGIYIGPIFDKYGPRWLIAAGVVCVVTAQMLFSICTGKKLCSRTHSMPDELTVYRVLALPLSIRSAQRHWMLPVVHSMSCFRGPFLPRTARLRHWYSERRRLDRRYRGSPDAQQSLLEPIPRLELGYKDLRFPLPRPPQSRPRLRPIKTTPKSKRQYPSGS
jgi:MFS family permease